MSAGCLRDGGGALGAARRASGGGDGAGGRAGAPFAARGLAAVPGDGGEADSDAGRGRGRRSRPARNLMDDDDDDYGGEFDEEYEREQIRLLNEKLDDRAESIGNVPQRLWKYNIGDYLKSADEIYNRELALETKDEEERGGWVVHIVSIRRVIKVTKTGGVMRSAVVVVAGDGKGTAGFAKARAPDVQTASQKAFRMAKSNPFYLKRYFYPTPLFEGDNTIFFPSDAKFSATKVKIWPGSAYTGLRCNKTISMICDAFGITDINAKVHGSRNKLNTVKAVFKALSKIKTPAEVAEARGLSYRELSYAERRALTSPTWRNRIRRAERAARREQETAEVLRSLKADPPRRDAGRDSSAKRAGPRADAPSDGMARRSLLPPEKRAAIVAAIEARKNASGGGGGGGGGGV